MQIRWKHPTIPSKHLAVLPDGKALLDRLVGQLRFFDCDVRVVYRDPAASLFANDSVLTQSDSLLEALVLQYPYWEQGAILIHGDTVCTDEGIRGVCHNISPLLVWGNCAEIYAIKVNGQKSAEKLYRAAVKALDFMENWEGKPFIGWDRYWMLERGLAGQSMNKHHNPRRLPWFAWTYGEVCDVDNVESYNNICKNWGRWRG